jgi:hypothetical protein
MSVATSSAMAVASGMATIALRGGALKVVPPPLTTPRFIASAWYDLPQPFRFFVSANLGNVCFFCCEKAVSTYLQSSLSDLPDLIKTHRDTVSFFLGYVLHIVGQHYLHAMLVYGPSSIDTPQKYRKTLFGMYCTLMSAAVGSTILNGFFLSYGMDKTVAFVTTIMCFASVNYFMIGWVVKRSNQGEGAKKTSKRGSKAASKKKVVTKPPPKKDARKSTPPKKKTNAQQKKKSLPRKKPVSMRGGSVMPDLTVSREWVRSTGKPVTVDDTESMDMTIPSPPPSEESDDRVLGCKSASRRASTMSSVLVTSTDSATSIRGGAKAVPKTRSSKITSKISNTRHTISNKWFVIPKPVRFFVSGNLGNVCFFYCERAVSAGLDSVADLPEFVETYKGSVSFFLGYVVHIVFQHFLHASLVYGLSTINTPAKYLTTLFGTYGTYVTSAVLSTALNGVFIKMGMDKTVAFVSTLYFFAIINYLVIGWIVKKSNAAQEAVTTKKGSRQPPRKTNNTSKRVISTNTNTSKRAVQPKKKPKKAVQKKKKTTSSWLW